MIENTEWEKKAHPMNFLSAGLSPSEIVKFFWLTKEDLKGKYVTDMWWWYSNFSTYLKNNYDIKSAIIVDKNLKNIKIQEYYNNIDEAHRSLKWHRKEYLQKIQEAKTKEQLGSALVEETWKHSKEQSISEMESIVAHMDNIIEDMGNDLSMYEFTLNSSSIEDLEWIPEWSQDKAFMNYVLRYVKDIPSAFKNIYNILKDDGVRYDIGHKDYIYVWQKLWVIPKYIDDMYGVSLSKKELWEIIEKYENQ